MSWHRLEFDVNAENAEDAESVCVHSRSVRLDHHPLDLLQLKHKVAIARRLVTFQTVALFLPVLNFRTSTVDSQKGPITTLRIESLLTLDHDGEYLRLFSIWTRQLFSNKDRANGKSLGW